MTWAAMIMSVMLSAQSAGIPAGAVKSIQANRDELASMLTKQAELIEAQDETIALLEQKALALQAAIDEYKKAVVSLNAEVDGQMKVAETYKKLWQAEMEYSLSLVNKAKWAERFVALKWVGIGAAGGVLAMEVAK